MIEVRGLTKIYPPNTVALRDLSLTIPDGQFVTVIGPSGAGKSSLLRCLNGLVAPTAGEILAEGEKGVGASQGVELCYHAATGAPRTRGYRELVVYSGSLENWGDGSS